MASNSHRTVDAAGTVILEEIELDPVEEELQEEDYDVSGMEADVLDS